MKALTRILPLMLLVFVLTECINPPEADEPTPPANLLQYTILNDSVTDTPFATQVCLDLLLMKQENEVITEQRIRDLLNYMYAKTMNRTGFEYSKHPTEVLIYLFTTKERAGAGMGQWLGMFEKVHYAKEPEISINEKELNTFISGEEGEADADERWGLTTEERKEVWRKLILLQDKAQEEAEAKYPLDDPNISIDEVGKYNQYYSDLNKLYKSVLAKDYRITVAIVDSVVKEGFEKSWTIPARK